MGATEATEATNLAVIHPPQLDLPVVRAGHDQRHGRVERSPVGAAVVAFEDVLHDAVGLTEKVGGARAFVVAATRHGRDVLLAETCCKVA